MTTETKFKETADTLSKNMDNGVKWLQDNSVKLVEAQKQQFGIATEMLNKSFTSFKLNSNDDLINSISSANKAFLEMYQKNMESSNIFLKNAMKPLPEFAKFSDTDSITKEMKKQFETFNKRINDLTLLNQTNCNALQKQVDSSIKSITPLMEKIGKELENSTTSTLETFQTIIDSNNDFLKPNIEARKEIFEKINSEIKQRIEKNIKLWSDLMNINVSEKTKGSEPKVENDLLKVTSSANGKKYATETSVK